ncbi:MAG: polysaccharide biosynthesis tyrosine autokinase, partial [Bradyrhizobium sp.]|nr:polysaccharide biosynthesis tyrosine autokinase [Bradyrhizobium sp.]
ALASGGENESIHVITRPWTQPRPVRPRKKLTVATAGVLGIIFGVALCFFLEYLDTTVKTKEDAERLLRAPVIGFVPALHEDDYDAEEGETETPPELMALAHPRSAVAEAFRSIRTALAFSSVDGDDLRHLLVTSASPSEGKTLVSVNIAQTLAQAGKRVLLVDADMRKPRVHKVFGIPSRPGLSNLLANKGAGDINVLARPAEGIDGLRVMPAGPLPPNPAELLGSAHMRELLQEMSDHFDTVIFDTPPAAHVTDAIVLSQYVHGVVLVVRCFTTQREMARRSRDLIAQAHGRLLGVVLNNVDVPRGAYSSYYYRQYYYYYYGEGDHRKKRGRRSKQRRGGDEATPAPAEAEPEHGRAT